VRDSEKDKIVLDYYLFVSLKTIWNLFLNVLKLLY